MVMTNLVAEIRPKARVATVPERLAALAELFRERNAVYGDTYKHFGRVMRGFFPDKVTLETEADWSRLAVFFHCADKLARYAAALAKGGHHADSLRDLSVYAQMLAEYDDESFGP